MPNNIAIILARMGSSWLQSKSIAEVACKSMIAHIIERLKSVGSLAQVVLATPDTPDDKPLQEIGRAAGANIFAGAEEDVLDRLYQAAREYNADLILHVGGDCPFVDPVLVQKAIDLQVETQADYVSNILLQTFPSGMDIDAITFKTLAHAWKSAKLRTTRRHPLAYINQNRHEFHIENFAHKPDIGHKRWTLDYQEDLDFVRAIYDRLYAKNPVFGLNDILALLEKEPELEQINAKLSDFSEKQPAYWDSEGYLTDLRIDLRNVLDDAIAADEAGNLAQAAQQYEIAQKLLNDLSERAKCLGK